MSRFSSMSDAAVAALLERALHERLDPADVQVRAVAAGVRRRTTGAGRTRTRRRVSVAAACAGTAVAVAVPLAVLAPGGRPGRGGVGPAAPDTRPTTAPSRPAVAFTPTDDPRYVAYVVPDTAGLPASAFPRRLTVIGTDQSRAVAPVTGQQSCRDGRRTGALPVAARRWTYAEDETDREQLAVDLTVTGWAAGTGAARFADVVHDSGLCSWDPAPANAPTTGLTGDQVWAGSYRPGPDATHVASGVAVVRTGDLLVAVTVKDPGGAPASLELAKRLATQAVQRVVAAGVGRTVAPTTVPDPASSTPLPPGIAYDIPLAVRPVPKDLPAPLMPVSDHGDDIHVAPVPGQTCEGGAGAARLPVTGRSWVYREAGTTQDPLTATVTVTGWAAGTGRRVFPQLVRAEGCRWADGPAPTAVSTDGLGGDDAWAGRRTLDPPSTGSTAALATGHAVVRVSDLVVAVEVRDRPGQVDVVALAEHLASVTGQRLRQAHVG